jgi:hypothetical protein
MSKSERKTTMINVIFFLAVGQKMEVNINVLLDGDIAIEAAKKDLIDESPNLDSELRIVLPLFKYLKNFISQQKYLDSLSDYRLINEREQYLLKQVREGNYTSMKIKFNEGTIERIEMTKEKKMDNATRLSDIMLKGGYQLITLNTQDGIISYATVTDKKKF